MCDETVGKGDTYESAMRKAESRIKKNINIKNGVIIQRRSGRKAELTSVEISLKFVKKAKQV